MSRASRTSAVAILLVMSTPALAERRDLLDVHPAMTGLGTPCVTVPMTTAAFTPHAGQISSTLYLERCRGGCAVLGGSINDARTMTSAIPAPGTSTQFPEFANHLGETGAAADAEWDAIVSCVREVYSWYDVDVTDVRPPAGLSFHLNLVSGRPGLIGLPTGTLGISPFACSAQDNVMSFSFADAHGASTAEAFVKDVCWTASHEAGHAFSLEHQFTFVDGRSACSDPMSYPTGACNPQRFFRNDQARCGGFMEEPCLCGPTQNSHLKLLGVFGAGTSTVSNPTVAIMDPAPGAQIGRFVNAQAGSRRGVARVELLVNGAAWGEAAGAVFGQNGQPDPSVYSIRVPDELPGGVLDLTLRAYDDLGAFTDSAVVTALKGEPCATASSCANGQRCEEGRCFWEPAAGELGDACTYPQFCLSGMCQGTAEQQICTQDCIPGVGDSCPADLRCVEAAPGRGICYLLAEEGGGCSAGSPGERGGSPWLPAGVGVLLAGVAFRRRRRA